MPFVFLGYLISIIFRFLLILANSWQSILAFISIERFSKLRDAPRDAIISTSTKKRGKGFGLHQTMDTAGAIFGSILALILFWKFEFDFKKIVLVAGSISILSLIPLFLVKEKKIKPIKKSLKKGIKNLNKKLKYFIFVSSIFILGNFGLYMFLILQAKETTGSTTTGLILYIIFNITWAIFTIPFGNLSDKIGRKKVLMIGYILFFILSIGFIFQKGIIYLTILFILYGLVYAITQSNQKAFVSDLSGKMKGTAMGFYSSITGIINIPAGLIAGYLWDISPKTMFIYISTVALISIIFLSFVKE